MTLASKITLVRVLLIPAYMATMYLSGGQAGLWMYLSLAIFAVASLTDYVDGYIARHYNQVSDFGKFLDPLADKLLVCSALIILIQLGRIPAWVVLIIIAREFIISGFRLVASDNGVVIAASYWGKFKTTFQMIMVCLMLANFAFLQIVTDIVMWISLVLTVVSLVDYLWKNKSVMNDVK